MSETATPNKETRGFQSEVKQLLHLMIHSLYSNKEIFLRELISNASDASDKLRFQALSNAELYQGDADLGVKLTFDADAKTLTVSDNGIGMSEKMLSSIFARLPSRVLRSFSRNSLMIKAKTLS